MLVMYPDNKWFYKIRKIYDTLNPHVSFVEFVRRCRWHVYYIQDDDSKKVIQLELF